MPRVSILMHAWVWGGTETNTLRLATTLADRGHDVSIIQFGAPVYEAPIAPPDAVAELARAGVRLLHRPAPDGQETAPFAWWWRTLRALPTGIRVLSLGGFDMRTPGLDVAVRLTSRRYVSIQHHPALPLGPRTSRRHFGIVPGFGLWWWRFRLGARLHVGLTHRLVACSEAVRAGVVERTGLPPERFDLVHFGVDMERFRFAGSARESLRHDWGVPADAIVFGAVGRLHGVKGYDRAIAALAAIRERDPSLPLWLVLVGRGDAEGPLRALAERLGVADRVRFPGFVDSGAAALSALDVFVMPSMSEGLGMALIEAMACERPSVVMDSGGPAEVLTSPALGRLTPQGDVPAFGAAMEELARLSADERTAMGRRARTHVERHFDARRQFAIYASMIEAGRTRRARSAARSVASAGALVGGHEGA